MTVLIIDNYDSFTFNLYQMLQVQTAEPVQVERNDALTCEQIIAMNPSRIVLSPGPGHPACRADFGVCADIITRHDEIKCPVLGVCLGHQGIVQYLGGSVVRAPKIVHGKTSVVTISLPSPLFSGLPEKLSVMRYHSLVASDNSFPSELAVVAREETEQLIMAVQHRTRPLYGVQFHPESIGTFYGSQILENFLKLC